MPKSIQFIGGDFDGRILDLVQEPPASFAVMRLAEDAGGSTAIDQGTAYRLVRLELEAHSCLFYVSSTLSSQQVLERLLSGRYKGKASAR